MFFPF